MILNIVCNENKLELWKLNLSQDSKILTCTSKDTTISIDGESCYGISSIAIYRVMVAANFNNIKLIIDPDVLYSYPKEIMIMLSSIGMLEHFDKRFWTLEDGIQIPYLNRMISYLSSLLVRRLSVS